MIEKIRHGFETNSSSTHSLVLTDSSEGGSLMLKHTAYGKLESGILTIQGEECFGWEWQVYDMPSDKINYLLIDANGNSDLVERIRNLLIKHLSEIENIIFPVLENIGTYSAYIDHQSVGTSAKVRNFSDEELWYFISSQNNVVRTGNDNDNGYFGQEYQ